MSSYQLSLSDSDNTSSPPIDLTFSVEDSPSSTAEVMACLFVDGTIKLWSINTNMEKKLGRRDPLLIRDLWSGSIPGIDPSMSLPRQIGLTTCKSGWTVAVVYNEKGEERLACKRLRWEDENLVLEKEWIIKLPGRKGRLLTSNHALYWQTAEGVIFESKCFLVFSGLFIYRVDSGGQFFHFFNWVVFRVLPHSNGSEGFLYRFYTPRSYLYWPSHFKINCHGGLA